MLLSQLSGKYITAFNANKQGYFCNWLFVEMPMNKQQLEALIKEMEVLTILPGVYAMTRDHAVEDSKLWQDKLKDKAQGSYTFLLHDNTGWCATCDSLSEVLSDAELLNVYEFLSKYHF